MVPIRQERTASGLCFSVSGSGPPLVLVHGLMARGAMFEPLLPLLSSEFQLIVPDLRGYGASAELPGPYGVERSAADLVDVLDQLGVSAAVLLGYSHGGPVCQQLARMFPARVDRLILVCTYAHNTSTLREYLESWVFSALVWLFGARRVSGLLVRSGASIGGGPPLSAEQASWLRGVLSTGSRAATLSGVRDLRVFDSRAWLSTLATRALVVAGAEDEGAPAHHFALLTSQLRKVESRVVDGAGHSLVWTHTAELARIVREWLQQG